MTSEPPSNSAMRKTPLDQADDGSSSSLSDPGDRTGNEDADGLQDIEIDGSEAYDTEAETERLEKTPRKQRNVLLTSGNGTYHSDEGLAADEVHTEESPNPRDPDQVSDSSLQETADEDDFPPSQSSSRKRKLSEINPQRKDEEEAVRDSTVTASKISRSLSLSSVGSPMALAEDEDRQSETREPEPTLKQSHKKGKRKGKKTKDDEARNKGERASRPRMLEEAADHAEAASSNGEEVEMEDVGEGDGADVDSAAKTEESLMKKKSAMDSLSAIENCFATLRDKLFDERLAQYNDELAMLEQSVYIHPELLLMKDVIDRRRDQKIKYEQTLLKFRLESLQRESIATKAQIHSQYMQTAGELRDASVAQINSDIYQTQRERRSCEADLPDYMYAFTTKRSQQITQQTAYNEEVSLLSGIAKYIGFPAAPEVVKARANEYEEDERACKRNIAMENGNEPRNGLHTHPPILRASLSAASTRVKPQPAAEDQFMQQNAWANPQHPAHQKHRQVSALSRAETPSSTPANQKRIVDLTQPHGSASTIPELPSGPNSSMAPTPATGEVNRDSHLHVDPALPQKTIDVTPSRITGVSIKETPVAQVDDQSQAAVLSRPEQNSAPSTSKLPERESHTPSALAKPTPFMQSSGGASRTSPARYPLIKAEDVVTISRHSPIAHQFQASPPITTAANGQVNRFLT